MSRNLREGGHRIGEVIDAAYADHAVSPICVSCHNAHLRSVKRGYKLNDVLGGVVITVPAPE